MALKGNKHALKHGYAHLPEYRVWLAMKSRCYNVTAKDYKYYGAKGVVMSKPWKEAFENFYTDMGPRPSKDHQIDRTRNDRGYSASNCKWVTRLENMSNRRNTVRIRIDGVTKTMKEWSALYNINYETAKSRRRAGLKGKKIFE